MKHDLVHIQGKAYVLVPLHEYRGMTSGPLPEHDLAEDVINALSSGADNPIKTIRKFRGLTQMQLSEKSGLSRPYLAELETGRKEGSVTALKNLAAALNVNISFLL